MKLIYCRRCHDVFKLTQQLRSCQCGMSKGMYADEIHAQYTGEFAVPLGFANQSLVDAVRQQPQKDTEDRKGGVRFEAFVIPVICGTMERLS